MFEYITYVRPFAEALSHQLGRLPTNDVAYTHNRPYLFTGANFQPYSTTHLSRAVQRQSQRVGLGRLTFARYRQAALAIAKQHVALIAKPFDPDHPPEDDPRLSFARQAGHRPRVLATAYTIDRAYPTRLQPELLDQYWRVSASWHEWLQISKLQLEIQAQGLQGQDMVDNVGMQRLRGMVHRIPAPWRMRGVQWASTTATSARRRK
jgi:hypothetical protein